ncbi:MAG: response regulator [bacterium]|nr:response regulator [bacterium]
MAKKVLIIEDDTFLGEVLAQKCTLAGYEPSIAVDGQSGLAKIKEWKPDIILLDILLPIMNGLDVLKAKKEDPSISEIPVMVVTNSGDQGETASFTAFGVKEFLVKAQFDPGEIIAHINRILDNDNNKVETEVKKYVGVDSNGVTVPPPSISSDTLLSKSAENSKSLFPDELLKTKKILWVEDDKFLIDLISRKLNLLGCNVVYAETGEIALTIVEKEKPDIILLDILLPGMTGIEVLEKIKANPNVRNIPALMLSNFSQEADIKRCYALGAEKYMVKATVTLDEIVGEIKRVLLK